MNDLEDKIQRPTSENKLNILSDGNFEYQTVLPEYFGENCLNYGQIIKIKEKGRVVGKLKKIFLAIQNGLKPLMLNVIMELFAQEFPD